MLVLQWIATLRYLLCLIKIKDVHHSVWQNWTNGGLVLVVIPLLLVFSCLRVKLTLTSPMRWKSTRYTDTGCTLVLVTMYHVTVWCNSSPFGCLQGSCRNSQTTNWLPCSSGCYNHGIIYTTHTLAACEQNCDCIVRLSKTIICSRITCNYHATWHVVMSSCAQAGETALYLAASKGYVNIVKMLINQGAAVDLGRK